MAKLENFGTKFHPDNGWYLHTFQMAWFYIIDIRWWWRCKIFTVLWNNESRTFFCNFVLFFVISKIISGYLHHEFAFSGNFYVMIHYATKNSCVMRRRCEMNHYATEVSSVMTLTMLHNSVQKSKPFHNRLACD